jgi:hypothetical protein
MVLRGGHPVFPGWLGRAGRAAHINRTGGGGDWIAGPVRSIEIGVNSIGICGQLAGSGALILMLHGRRRHRGRALTFRDVPADIVVTLNRQ